MSPGQYLTGALSGFGQSSSVYGLYGAVMFMLLGALIGGSDWGLGTIKTAMLQGAGRLRTALGQYLAIVIALVASVLITFAAAAVASAIAAVGHAGSLSALPDASTSTLSNLPNHTGLLLGNRSRRTRSLRLRRS